MKRKLYVAEIHRDLFENSEILRLYVETDDRTNLEDKLKKYLKVNYNLQNIFIHSYAVDKEDAEIVKRVATVLMI